MATANERLADAAISHSVDLAQYSEGVARRMIRLLNRVDSDLADQLERALRRLPAESFTVERLEKLLGSIRDLNAQAYARIGEEITSELKAFAEVEASYQFDLFDRVIPKPVRIEFPIAKVSAEQVYSAALSRPFQGRLLRDWSRKLPADRMDVLRSAVRLGYVEGQTVSQIVSRVIGTPANRKQDGAFQRSRRDMAAVVQTAINHTAAVTRERFHEANEDIIESLKWSSTIDTRTSHWCIARSEKRYTVKTHKPIGHTIPWLRGPGAIHWRCRSVSVPVLKSTAGLGLEGLPPASKASMDGVIPAEMTFGEWLERQPLARQEQVLGAQRAKLVRKGELSVDRLYDNRGQWLSLDQLRERNAAAFERAGA